MKRAVVGAAVVGVLSLTAGCGSSGVITATPVSAPPTPVSAPPTTSSPTDVAVTAPATSALPAPTATAAPIPGPTVFTGVGETYLSITKPPGTTTVIATITGNTYGRFFTVKALDGDRDRLVQTNDPYSGSTVLDGHGGNTTRLYIKAYGSWTIKLSDPRTATVFGHAETGRGDTVLVYEGGGGRATVSGGQAGTSLHVVAYGAGSLAGDLVWQKAPYSGTVRWPGGTALIEVRAVGPWSISVN